MLSKNLSFPSPEGDAEVASSLKPQAGPLTGPDQQCWVLGV